MLSRKKLTRSFAAMFVAVSLPAAAPHAQDGAQLVHPKDIQVLPSGQTRIVGGARVRENAWPFQAWIYADGSACGGTVIAPNWVLTAAHCVVDRNTGDIADPENVFVQAGNVRRPGVVDDELQVYGEVAFAARIIPHQGYASSQSHTGDDIALLELDRPLSVTSARLAAGGIVEPVESPGQSVVAIGWGKTSGRTNDSSEFLLRATLPLVSNASCRREIGTPLNSGITAAQICAGGGAESTCQGDSGGPILAHGPDGQHYQIGITSWGVGTNEVSCGISPTVFTRVSAYVPWIEQYVELPRFDGEIKPPVAPVDTDTDRALVIGIDDYLDDANDLEGSGVDADNIVKMLTGRLGYRPEQIKVLKDQTATRAGILGAIESWLIEGSKPGGRVFVFFAGHGFYAPDTDGDEEDGVDEIILPHDAVVTETGIENAILDDEIRELLSRLSDRRVMVVVDSCHAGTMTRSLASDARKLRRMPSGGAWNKPLRLTRGTVEQAQLSRAFEPMDSHVTTWTAVSPSQVAHVDREAPVRQGCVHPTLRRWAVGTQGRRQPGRSRQPC